jgi:hypothetical protein
VLTKNFTVFIKFWRFNSFFDEAFTVTSRSKTIAALRLCVLDGNVSAVKWFKDLDLRFFIFRALFCVSLVLKVISFDRAAVLICSVAIFVDFFEFVK